MKRRKRKAEHQHHWTTSIITLQKPLGPTRRCLRTSTGGAEDGHPKRKQPACTHWRPFTQLTHIHTQRAATVHLLDLSAFLSLIDWIYHKVVQKAPESKLRPWGLKSSGLRSQFKNVWLLLLNGLTIKIFCNKRLKSVSVAVLCTNTHNIRK